MINYLLNWYSEKTDTNLKWNRSSIIFLIISLVLVIALIPSALCANKSGIAICLISIIMSTIIYCIKVSQYYRKLDSSIEFDKRFERVKTVSDFLKQQGMYDKIHVNVLIEMLNNYLLRNHKNIDKNMAFNIVNSTFSITIINYLFSQTNSNTDAYTNIVWIIIVILTVILLLVIIFTFLSVSNLLTDKYIKLANNLIDDLKIIMANIENEDKKSM